MIKQMSRLAWGACVVVALVFGLSAPSRQQTIEDLIERASQELKKQEARAKKLEAKKKLAVEQSFNEAKALYSKGKYIEAKRRFQSIVADEQYLGFFEKRELHRYLARIDSDIQEQQKRLAAEQERKALAARKNRIKRRLQEGESLFKQGRYIEAKAAFNEVERSGVKLGPFTARAVKKYLAQIDQKLAEQKRKAEEETARKAVARRQVMGMLDEGERLAKDGKLEEAAQTLGAAMARKAVLDPPEAKRLNDLYARVQKTLNDRRKALAAKRDRFLPILRQGMALYEKGEYAKAKPLLAQAKQAQDAFTELDKSRLNEALAQVDREIVRQQRDLTRKKIDRKFIEAVAHIRAQNWQDAMSAFNEIEKLAGKDESLIPPNLPVYKAQVQAAMVREKRGEPALILPPAVMAKEKPSPKDVERYFDEMRKRREAQRQLDVATAEHHYKMGKSYMDTLQFAKARDEFQHALRLNPELVDAKKALQEVNAYLGKRSAEQVVESIVSEKQVKLEGARMEMMNTVEEGKRLLKQKKFDEALDQFEHAHQLAKLLRRDLPIQAEMRMIEDMIESVKSRKEREAKRLSALEEEQAKREKEADARRREDREIAKKAQLFTEGYRLMSRGQYKDAMACAQQLMDVDPQDQAAEVLHEEAEEAMHRQELERLDRLHTSERLKLLRELRERAIPYSELSRYPDKETWEKISSRSPVSYPSREEESSPAAQKIREALKKPVTLDFSETPIEDVIVFLTDFTGVNIVLDKNALSDENVPITLKVSDVPLKNALDFILKQANLDWTIKNDVLFISNEEGLSGEPIRRVYDIRDLLLIIEDKPGGETQLGGGGGGTTGGTTGGATGGMSLGGTSGGSGTSDTEDELDLDERGAGIVDLITRTVAPQTWSDAFIIGTSGGDDNQGGGGDDQFTLSAAAGQGGEGGAAGQGQGIIGFRAGDLVVWQTPEVHAEIEALLKDLRKTQHIQVHVEARFIDATDSFVEDYGVEIQNFVNNNKMKINAGPDHIYNTTDDFAEGPSGHIVVSGGPNIQTIWAPFFPSAFPGTTLSPLDTSPGKVRNILLAEPLAGGSNNPFIGTGAAPGPTGLNLHFSILDDTLLNGFLRAVQESSEAQQVSAPRITLTNAQRGNIIVATQTNYVYGFTAQQAQAIPQISQIQEGIQFDVRPIVSADRRYVYLEVTPSITDVLAIDNFVFQSSGNTTTNGAVPPTLTIQLPRMRIEQVEATVAVPDKGTLLIGGLATRDDSKSYAGVPILSKLPLIRRLFSRDSNNSARTNLLILLKPTIMITSEAEAEQT